MIEINDEYMSSAVGGELTVTDRFTWDTAADGHRAWIVSCHLLGCSPETRESKVLMLAARLAAGYGAADRFAIGPGGHLTQHVS